MSQTKKPELLFRQSSASSLKSQIIEEFAELISPKPIDIKLPDPETVTNTVYLPYYDNQARYLVLYGGAGSGKSYFAAEKFLKRLLLEKGHRILVVRKVARTLRDSCFKLFLDIISDWNVSEYVKINYSDMRIACPSNGNEIIFAGLDDVEKLKSITRVTSIWIEEASEITRPDFQQIDLRLRGKTPHYKQIILTFNPISELSWLKGYFFDRIIANSDTLKTTYKDNRFLDAEYIALVESYKEHDQYFYEVYTLGNWGVLGNLIFRNWTVEEFELDFDNIDIVLAGVDFGWEHPNAWLLLAIKELTVHLVDEIRVVKTKKPDFAKMILEKEEQWQVHPSTYCDSSEPASIEELEDAGLWVYPAEKGKDSVTDGISVVQKYKLVIHPRCINALREIKGYKRREDRDGNVLEEPVKFQDDLMCALRYALYTYRRQTVGDTEEDYELAYDDQFVSEGKY